MRVRATAFAEGTGGGGAGLLRPMLWLGALLGVVVALIVLLGQLRETVLLSSPEVQRAEVRAQVAAADHRAAELQRDTATIRSQQASEAAWQPILVGAQRLALLGLLLAIPAALVAGLIAGIFILRRHLSLPTRDGRVPLVGLDRELSREALLRYQALRATGPALEVLLPPRGLAADGEDEGWGGDSYRRLAPQQEEIVSSEAALTGSSRFAAPPLRSGPPDDPRGPAPNLSQGGKAERDSANQEPERRP